MADPTLADALKASNVEFDRAELQFNIARGTTLAKPDDLDSIQSPDGTTVRLVLRPNSFLISFSPPLKLVTKQWYAENAFWHAAEFRFPKTRGAAEELSLDIRRDAALLQGDPTEEIRAGITKAFRTFIAGTSFADPNFSPLDFPNPQQLLGEVQKKVAGGTTSTTAKFPAAVFDAFFMSITIRPLATVTQVDPKAGGLVVSANKAVKIEASFPQNGGEIQKWFEDRTKPLPTLDAISVTSEDGIVVRVPRNGTMQDVVQLQGIKLTTGPTVTVTRFQLLGFAKEWAEKERGVITLLTLFAHIGSAAAAGAGDEAAVQYGLYRTAMDNPDAVIVPGVTRRDLERTLTAQVKLALAQFFADHLQAITTAIPNYAHARIFGMPLNRSEAPPNRSQ